MRKLTLLAVLATSATLSASLGGCIHTSRDPATGKVDVDVESPTKTGEDWHASVAGEGVYSAMTGKATALVANGQTTVDFKLDKGTPGQTHPWHVHEGKCGSGGPIVGNASDYPPITIGAGGHGEANAKLAARLDEAKDYYVNVHASAAEMSTIIACGDLDD